MAIGDLNPADWRIEIYKIKSDTPFSGYITDLSNFYTSELSITKERNYPDEITFTLDLAQLQARAETLGTTANELLEPYVHKVKVYRDSQFMAQAIVVKTSVNLNNESKNTVEVSCVDTLGLFEKRLIHQDYGEGSWADFAKQVVMDAQHEPNRIYNYAFEGDATSIDNVWFRGWKYQPGKNTLDDFPEWEPNKLYSMYDKCTHDAKFWEAKEHAFISGETFSESNWTLLGILDQETGDIVPAYAVWREDNEEPGPTNTALGGWGGTSSCHVTAKTVQVNNSGSLKGINMANGEISTTLVAPYNPTTQDLPKGYKAVSYIESTGTQYIKLPNINLSNSHQIKVVAAPMDLSINQCFWCSRTETNVNTNTLWWLASDRKFRRDYGANQATLSNIKAPVVGRYITFETKNNELYIDGELAYTSPAATFTPTGGTILFASMNSGARDLGNYTKMRLYSVQIRNSSGTLLYNLVPCRREADDVAGLYDVTNNVFYTNNGTGQFQYGGDIYSHHLYSRVMARNVSSALPTTMQFFIEGYGGAPKIYSPTYTVTGDKWQKIEHNWAPQPFPIYRLGIKTMSGEVLYDSPVTYQAPVEGDEWDLGIRVGVFPTDAEQLDAEWDRTRHSTTFEWKNAKSCLFDLSNMEADNFWYLLDESNKLNFYVNAGSDVVSLELSYPRNITSMIINSNANDIVNYIKGDGSADVKQDPMVSNVNVDQPNPFTWVDYNIESMQKYWALAQSNRYDSETTIAALRADIASEINTYSNIQDVPTIKIANNAVSPSDLYIGDMVSVEVFDIPYVKKINSLYKIQGFKIQVDIDGNESVSLTLLNPTQNQINALSFPQIVKNLVNRLHS